jgi:hypothetical protein
VLVACPVSEGVPCSRQGSKGWRLRTHETTAKQPNQAQDGAIHNARWFPSVPQCASLTHASTISPALLGPHCPPNVCPTQSELLEWQLVTQWSHTYHKRLPAAFRAAVKTLLAAAAAVTTHGDTPSPAAAAAAAAAAGQPGTPDSTMSGSGGSMGQQQLLSQLPGPVLEQVCVCALG